MSFSLETSVVLEKRDALAAIEKYHNGTVNQRQVYVVAEF